MTPSLSVRAHEVVVAFLAENPALASPAGSFNECLPASRDLATALEDAGIETTIIQVQGVLGDGQRAASQWKDLGDKAFWAHYAVEVEGQVVDVTARQFDHGCDHPLIYPADEIPHRWGNVWRIEPIDLRTSMGW